jgi:glutamyl-tRNA synthetase
VFTIDEMVAAFEVTDVNPNPARFDQKKAESINGDHIRMLERTISPSGSSRTSPTW